MKIDHLPTSCQRTPNMNTNAFFSQIGISSHSRDLQRRWYWVWRPLILSQSFSLQISTAFWSCPPVKLETPRYKIFPCLHKVFRVEKTCISHSDRNNEGKDDRCRKFEVFPTILELHAVYVSCCSLSRSEFLQQERTISLRWRSFCGSFHHSKIKNTKKFEIETLGGFLIFYS